MRKVILGILFLTLLTGGVAMAALVDNGDDTVTDTETGLMWQKETASGAYTWQQALAHAEGMTLGGHSDWRLPNLNELQTLVDYSRNNPSINPLLEANTVSSYYWSSTTAASYTYRAWLVSFYGGGVHGSGKSGSYYVRAVRSGQAGSFDYSIISVLPGSADFGSVDVEATSQAKSFTITNTGTADLEIGTISIAGAAASEFNIQDDNCSGQTVAPSGTYTMKVVFSPASEGSKSATLLIPSNDPETPTLSVPLSGAGVLPVDTTKPVVTGLSNDAVPAKCKTWTWDATDASSTTFRYLIDQNAEWTPPGDFADVTTATKSGADGTWYLHVQAKDTAGNESEVVSVLAVLDNTPPLAVISGMSESPTNQTGTTLVVGGDQVTHYKCRLDEGNFSDESSAAEGIPLTGLSEGAHTVYIIGKDAAGNWQSEDSATSVSWTVDITAPVVTGLSGSSDLVQSKSWTWDANEDATFRYAVDQNPAWIPSGDFTSVNTAGKSGADGIWYIHVQAKDTAGNVTDVVTVSAALDNAPPTAFLSSRPDNPTAQTEATFTVGGDGVTHYKYKLDDNLYTNEMEVQTDVALVGLGEESHTLYVIGRDSAGNWQVNPTTVTWTVDTTVPVITGLSNDPKPIRSKTWTWDAADATATTFRYVIDQNQVWNDPSGDFSDITTATIDEADGTWYIHVQARDAAGNVSEVATVSAILDSTSRLPKAIIVAGGGSGAWNNLWNATEMNANHAYRALIYQGYSRDTIYYLSSTDIDVDGNGALDDVDADATNRDFEYAITNWAKNADNLFIYMIDHGGVGTFRMGAAEFLEVNDLDTWLDTIQETIPGAVTLVYDACRSGSFLPLLLPPAGKGRILATSASADQESIFLDQGTISFSFLFWARMFNGDSFYDSFVHAKNSVGITHAQAPLLDANGNGIGNEKGDKDATKEIRIGNEMRVAGDIPCIGSVSPAQTLEGETSVLIYANDVFDLDGISRVWAIITPPNCLSSSPDDPVTDLPTIDLTPIGNNRYETTYSRFTNTGTYNIAIFAADVTDAFSLPKQTTVIQTKSIGDINGDGNVDLADALIALKMLAGMDVSDLIRADYATSGVDVNGDNKIGMEEAVYIMQKISELRD
ncbi:MAG: DUF1566 domain-containing protein [Thermodesulfobacteriota bacterium]|nr:DUF1566 domain-containing protein [Thermodesulfobacteriota bacterium]